jgi:hypothetical protein
LADFGIRANSGLDVERQTPYKYRHRSATSAGHTTQTKRRQTMRAYEVAQEAVRTGDKRKAEWLCLYLQRRHGLNISSIRGYLAAHDVDVAEWEELLL